MYKQLQKNIKYFVVVIAIIVFFLSGCFDYVRETSFEKFKYPLEENIKEYIKALKRNESYPRPIINEYKYNFLISPDKKCHNSEQIRLVLVIRTSLDNFKRREAIRQTWGDEDRFPGIEIRRLFMVGNRENTDLIEMIQNESKKYNDLIQGDFIDSYYNTTTKTMMSFKWLVKNCDNSKYYMFVDDDYYVSIKNVLSYTYDPLHYPKDFNELEMSQPVFDVKYFYSGHCVEYPRPMRDYFNKFRISINEYPFNKYPVFPNGGGYFVSKNTLEDMYYASYYTKHFMFDDVFLGIISHKIGINPYHTKYMAREWTDKEDEEFKRYCIASHGFEDTQKMVEFWNIQRNLGYA